MKLRLCIRIFAGCLLAFGLLCSCGKEGESPSPPQSSTSSGQTGTSAPTAPPEHSVPPETSVPTDPSVPTGPTVPTDPSVSAGATSSPALTEPPAGSSDFPAPSASGGDRTDSPAQLEETEDMGQEYIDKITFLGDSTTYGLRYYKMLAGERDTTQVWTPKSGTLSLFQQSFALIVYPETGEEITILEAVERKKPEMMVITLGVNGVSMMDEEYFKSEYTALVEGIQRTSPDTRIILQSIFPVASSYEYLKSINNEKITRANGWVMDVAEETGVRYLDTQTVLKGEDGWLPQSYQNGDGLHLNETSFALVLEYIRTHGWQ